jgi:DNA-directed RNA polymerase subunit RPC12/RpoP
MTEFKFFCPQCGQQIQCDTGYAGTQINCPACQQSIVVPQMPRVVAPAGQPPVPVKSRLWRNVLVIAASVVILAGLVTAGWLGYSKLIRGHLPLHPVALWSGEGNGNDSVGGNEAMLTDISFEKGKVGQAFSLNGETSRITVPASKNLVVSNLTFEAWIFPTDFNQARPIIEYGGSGQAMSIGLWINTSGGTSLVPGAMYAAIRDHSSMGKFIEVKSDGGVVALNQWNHVTFTYDTKTRAGILYCNGDQVGSAVSETALVPRSFCQVNLGYRDVNSLDILRGCRFAGLLDEIAIYNRALSAEEIKNRWLESKSR